MSITISALYTYPIKSCSGLSHEQITLTTTGPAYDRHWVITDPDGMFITQRTYPKMALIQPRFEGDTMILSAPGMEDLIIPLSHGTTQKTAQVTVWKDTVEGADEGDTAASWLSDYIGIAVRLYHMPPTTVRRVNPGFARRPAQVGFADGYPLLLISEESLADLNTRLSKRHSKPLTMHSFRPNIVVQGVEDAYAEDSWGEFRIDDIFFDIVKPCARCTITTVDPNTGEVPDPQEPLATLATYRKGANGVLFGQNIIHRGAGNLTLGDRLIIV